MELAHDGNNLELSLTMQFVQMRAEAEVKAAHSSAVGIEHVFLGLLKLSELRADELFNAPEFIMDSINKDISIIRKMFAAAQIDTSRTRSLLRFMVRSNTTSDEEALNKCWIVAMNNAKDRHSTSIWAQDMLLAIINHPSDKILQVCPIQRDGKIVISEEKREDDTSPDEMSKEFLPSLTNNIRRMRAQLLSTVFGQDHVVHAFVEGMFAAEVLAASDEKRKRPRAVFVFAGPPGVGKTFLAEQAAEALKLPYKRFDMSSFADHQAYMALVGFEKSYHGAKPGTLTEFVKNKAIW